MTDSNLDRIVIPEHIKQEGESATSSSYDKSKRSSKKKVKEHYSIRMLSKLQQARLWTTFALLWLFLSTLLRLIFAFVSMSELSVAMVSFNAVLYILLFSAIVMNYMSLKYEDYSNIGFNLIIVNTYSLLSILQVKVTEGLPNTMSEEFLNLYLFILGIFVIITTNFINLVVRKYRMPLMAFSVVALHTLALIHQFGLSGVTS